MTKTKLLIEVEYEFLMCGICCHQMDYRLCWGLNQKLRLNLKKTEDYKLRVSPHVEDSFSFYKHQDAVKKLDYFIVSNKGLHGLLIKERPEVDYFLIIEGYHEALDYNKLLKEIRNVSSILTAFYIDPNQLKSKDNLLFE